MKCFVYYYNTLEYELSETKLLPLNSFYLRIFIGQNNLMVTFFRTNSDYKITTIFTQPIPIYQSLEERKLYWDNLGEHLNNNNIDELDIFNTNDRITNDIKITFTNFILNVIDGPLCFVNNCL